MDLRGAALTVGFVSLAVDVGFDGAVSELERRFWRAAPPAPPIVHQATRLGGRRVAGTVILAATIMSRCRGRVGTLDVVAHVASTIGGRAALARVIQRPRPPRDRWQETPSGFSFPSRHTTWAALAACELVEALPPQAHRWARIGAVMGVATVGVSRVWLGVHWPSDVAGAVLWTLACRKGTRWVHDEHLAKGRDA